jgi:ADP-ribose pyrophosphatase YjhB (NUDIX family)
MKPPSFTRSVPAGDSHARRVCDHCGFVDYENPRLIVGAVCVWQERVLLCRRAIEPRAGYWTLPAGFLELGETTAEGAAREAREESRAEIEVGPLLLLFDVPRIGQVHLFYRACLRSPEVGPTPESLECRLFAWSEIPWDALAFPSVRRALEAYAETRGQEAFAPRGNPPGDRGEFPTTPADSRR